MILCFTGALDVVPAPVKRTNSAPELSNIPASSSLPPSSSKPPSLILIPPHIDHQRGSSIMEYSNDMFLNYVPYIPATIAVVYVALSFIVPRLSSS